MGNIKQSCRDTNLKHSKQRDVIYNFLMTRYDHPTAETVYNNVRLELPNISLGTVYRNLQLLSNTGAINRLRFEDGSDHYDANITPHYHFICRKCEQVSDLDLPYTNDNEIEAENGFEGIIEGHFTYYYGLCGNCAVGK